MKFNRLISLPLFFCLQSLPIIAAEIPASAIEWPAGSELLIDKAIAIKVEAQQQNVQMFSEGGVHGHTFARYLDELAKILTEKQSSVDLLKKNEGADLKAKIALWALDRKARPEQYARLEHIHVSDNPIGRVAAERKAAVERRGAQEHQGIQGGLHLSDNRSSRRPRPQVVLPPEVADEDLFEGNRWIFEYLYFAPPTGRREWETSHNRFVLVTALSDIRDERSLVMLKFDLETQLESFPDASQANGLDRFIGTHARRILDFRLPRAFSIVASTTHHNGVRGDVRKFIKFLSEIHPEDMQNPWYPKLDDYRRFANMEWHTDAEKELASWIKAIPAFPPPTAR